MPEDATTPTRSWLDRVIDSSGSVYGIILASSIIAALSYKERGNAWVMVGALAANREPRNQKTPVWRTAKAKLDGTGWAR